MATADRPAFGDLLARHRRAAGLTQEELAERAGLSARGISDLERGLRRRPHPETVRLLARALALSDADRAALLAAARRPASAPQPAPALPGAAGLPLPLTEIIGRERDVAAVLDRLRHPRLRLLTLTGPGGVGKTRLAIQVAAEASADFPDGVVFVPLAPLGDPSLVAGRLAEALGLKETGRQGPVEALARHLRDRRILLVLDNFEHLLDAAPLVADLLARCPALRVLATSRAALRLSGEHEFAVPPLGLPSPGQTEAAAVARSAAARLFVARSQAANADFALTDESAAAVAAICTRLDGLPLAIELAAARARFLAPDALLARLDRQLQVLTDGARDLPPRQRAMRATLDWSYGLLGETERALFARLAVFAGGWTLAGAEAVGTGGTVAPEAVLELLARLVEQSLVVAEPAAEGGPRYRLLEPIRQYAEEHLAAGGEAEATRARHADYYIDLAEAEPSMSARQGWGGDWFTQMAREHDNLRAALGWAVATGDAARAQRLAGPLWAFWITRGHWREGRRWLEAALALPGEAPARAHAWALGGAGALLAALGDIAGAAPLLEESLARWRTLGDRLQLGRALQNLSALALWQGNPERAEALAEESFAVRQGLAEAAEALRALAGVAVVRGDLARAATLNEEILARYREAGHRWGLGNALAELAWVTLERGESERAGDLLAEALAVRRAIADTPGLADCLEGTALLAGMRGRGVQAARLAGAAAAVREEGGHPITLDQRARYERHLAATQARTDPAAWVASWTAGRAMQLDEAIATAEEELAEGSDSA